jgi:hypothetical protein
LATISACTLSFVTRVEAISPPKLVCHPSVMTKLWWFFFLLYHYCLYNKPLNGDELI